MRPCDGGGEQGEDKGDEKFNGVIEGLFFVFSTGDQDVQHGEGEDDFAYI